MEDGWWWCRRAITRSPGEFLQLLVEEGVTVLNQTPSAFYQLMQAEEENEESGWREAEAAECDLWRRSAGVETAARLV